MNVALFIKLTRLLLAICVSVWMAGGCLFGCGNMNAMAVKATPASASAAVDENCRVAQAAHSCCTRPVAQKQKQKTKAKTTLRTPKTQLAAFPSGTLTAPPPEITAPPPEMKDCPLLANNTAATSKSSGSQLDPGRTPVAVVPSIENLNDHFRATIASSHVPNRGPTHLRCCVFLI